jgi:hypothetical protein
MDHMSGLKIFNSYKAALGVFFTGASTILVTVQCWFHNGVTKWFVTAQYPPQ